MSVFQSKDFFFFFLNFFCMPNWFIPYDNWWFTKYAVDWDVIAEFIAVVDLVNFRTNMLIWWYGGNLKYVCQWRRDCQNLKFRHWQRPETSVLLLHTTWCRSPGREPLFLLQRTRRTQSEKRIDKQLIVANLFSNWLQKSTSYFCF